MCRESCYPDFTPLEDFLVEEGKLKREQVGWYATEHGPVADFIADPTRRVWMSETTPPKPFVVDWRLRPVDVLCPFLPTDPKKEVISINHYIKSGFLVIKALQVTEAIISDQIPGLIFKELSYQGVKQRKREATEESKSSQELRRLAYDFPKNLPATHVKPEKSNKKSKETFSKNGDPHDNWCKESVDYRVTRVLMRCRVVKQEKKKGKNAPNSEQRVKAGKTLGKLGRGDFPHEFWEEERRLREKKRKEKLAKEEKKRGAGCYGEQEVLPSYGSPGAGIDLNK